MVDVVAQMGPAFLGSRLKRLGERLQASAAVFVKDAGLKLQPGHMAIMAALRTGPKSVGQLADLSGTSQPGVTRALGQLRDLGMVQDEDSRDQRSRQIGLTSLGEETVSKLVDDIWPRIGGAAEQMLDDVDGDFLKQLENIEAALAERSIAQRATLIEPGGLRLRAWDDSLASYFHDINVEWIEDMYALEPTDRDTLENPHARIIEPGGDILFVEAPGLGIVGTCALKRAGAGAIELTKMGVRASARGLKAGHFLMAAAIQRAGELGADPLFLLTNRRSEAAIHLYEKYGFQHDAQIMADYGSGYDRCNVAMRYVGD